MARKFIVIFLLLTGIGFFGGTQTAQGIEPPSPPTPPGPGIDVAKLYTASGWMGDGQEGTKYVQLNEASVENPKSPLPTCIKITYTIGPKQWAGMYWLNKPDNWGDKPGEDLSKVTYSKITFWARGERGDEIVEFKAGGIDAKGKTNKDSFEVNLGKVRLQKGWTHYELNLTGQNLSSVIGLFCWVASGTANPNGLTFYLDDIRYE